MSTEPLDSIDGLSRLPLDLSSRKVLMASAATAALTLFVGILLVTSILPNETAGASEESDDGAATTETAEDEDGEPVDQAAAFLRDPIVYGFSGEFSNYNPEAGEQLTRNRVFVDQTLPHAFNFVGPGGQLEMTELLQSATVTSTDPQTIRYVVDHDAHWSDGNPVDCQEFYFTWKIFVELEASDPTVDTGYRNIESVECSDDGKTVTTTYSTTFTDWQVLFGAMMPVHVVARETGVDDIIDAFESGNRASIDAMAEFFSTGWEVNPGELPDESLIPSAGPLKLGSWKPGPSLHLVPNDDYWGTQASSDLVIRTLPDSDQAEALANGDIDVMNPQPTSDMMVFLEQIDGVVVEAAPAAVWEHFDFNFKNTALAIPEVREAFALCLPRKEMVTRLIDPLSPGAELLNNRLNQEFEPAYVDASGGVYDDVDLLRAQELLDESGIAQPVDVRLGWFDNGGNARRTDQVALTIDSCNQIGFNVIDNGSDTFFDVELPAGDWDIAMFAWAGSPLKTFWSEIYRTGGALNFGGYGNPGVDALLDQLSQELDLANQADLANRIDAILWEDLATIPVFSFPGVVAYRDDVKGVVHNPSRDLLTWNASTWTAGVNSD
jgi:peptide/nickel transport system substrate-binding protein